MKTNDNIAAEDALRKAVQHRAQRRAAECPAPADLEDLVMQRITNTVKSPLPTGGKSHHGRSYRLIIPVVSAAAAVLIGFLLWQHKESPTAITPETDAAESPSLATQEMPKQQGNEKEAQPVTVQQASQEHLLAVKQKENVVSQKSETESLEQKIAGLTIVPTSADLGPGVTMRAGKPCPITADKQALADLYLAEEALQVAYEQRAVREAVRAYTAGIKGEKLPKPVIAF